MGLMAALVCLALVPQEEKFDDAKIRQLIEQLGADFLEEREPARQALEKAGKAAELRLVEALASSDYRVRRACLELLSPLKSKAARERAYELFRADDDPSVRDAAFRLLRTLGKDAEDVLMAVLAHAQPEFRMGALQSLMEMRSQKCGGKVADLYDQESDKGVKEAAFKCLLALGKAAEPFLLKHLGDPDATIRRDCLRGLGESQSEEALAAVTRLFGQETDDQPLQQAYDLLQRAGPRGEPAFLAGLKSPRQPTRLRSITGLMAIKSEKALSPVAEVFLGECPPDVRDAAMKYLKSQGLRAEDALLGGLESKDPLVRLASIQTLGDIESARARATVGRLFREEKNKDLHEKCFEFFRRLGIRAEDDLLGALADEDKEIRRKSVVALGDAQSERAIPRLIEFITELDPVMKEASESALASIGPKAIEQVVQAAEAGRVRKPIADSIRSSYIRGEVERLLEAQLGEDDSTGFFEGQFKDLETFGREKSLPALIQILGDNNYVFTRAHRHESPTEFSATMKELTVMALGELGGDGVLAALKAFANNEAHMNKSMRRPTRIREETLVALHRQGEKKPLEDFLVSSRASADLLLKGETVDLKNQGCSELFSLGLMLDRLKRYDEAAQAYHELIRAIDQFKLEEVRKSSLGTCYYNLACLSSKSGDRSKGVELLEKAVRAGFIDRAWIRKDRDLDAIREEEGYKKILADDGLFEKKTDEIPPVDK